MKTMQKLIDHFNRLYPDYSIWLNNYESCRKLYRIAITDPWKNTSYYIFTSCREFKAWIENVILD